MAAPPPSSSSGISAVVLASILGFVVLIMFTISRVDVLRSFEYGGGGGRFRLDFLGGYYSLSAVQLQTRLPRSVEPQSVLNDSSSSSAISGHRLANSTHLDRKNGESRRKEGLEEGLARARGAIRMAATLSRQQSVKAAVYGKLSGLLNSSSSFIYRNPLAFYQSYMEMEKRFKVYVYEEGELPIVHSGPCKNIYSTEGRFIDEMEHRGGRFRTRDPHAAHVFFMPFSVSWMVRYLFKPLTYAPLQHFVSDYVKVISTQHPFWNRTQGADHFMVSCHDWAPEASKGNPYLYNTSIRVLCNANSSEGFNPQKDVSLPEIKLIGGLFPPQLVSIPPASTPRPYLAFFAGGLHGPIRPALLQHWKDRDPDLQVYQYLPKDSDYFSFMLKSKFCLCPSGYEVASPRILEAIYAGCVPVILSKNYVLPFSDVLRWEAISVQVDIEEIPKLKEVLEAVPEDKYMMLVEGGRAVRKHFLLNTPAKRYDMFHMVLHSIWLRRLNLMLQ
ncbi:hypothetical protein Dimus_010201 [Dionaea muscipula]